MRAGAAVSTKADPMEAGAAAARVAAAALADAPVDLAVVFASGEHLEAPESVLEAVHSVLAPRELREVRRLEDERDLEEWIVAQVTRRVQGIHQLFERHLLMGIGSQTHSTHSSQHLLERRIAGEVAA